MPKTHPHAEATYRVIPFDEGSFAIEVHIPDSYPTKISPFATEADAEAWIVDHQRRIEAQMQPGGWSRRTPRMGNTHRRPSRRCDHSRQGNLTIRRRSSSHNA